MIECDLLLKNIKQLVNPANDRVVRGRELNGLRLLEQVWVGAKAEIINFIGYGADFEKNCQLTPDALVLDGSQFVVFPGLIDPHTHLPFAGTRQDEFHQKLQGVSYQEIARKGGGIKATVRQTREIAEKELIALCESRLDEMLRSGTTTVEAKSGYGLNRETELKQLEVIRTLTLFHPVGLVPTLMAAHEIPGEFSGRSRDYLEYISKEILPVVKQRELAEFCDVFCEEGYFSFAETDWFLDEAKRHGFKLKVHADEFSSNGAAILAVRKGAVSAEHLIAITPEEIAEISQSQTACLLLPGVSFFLKLGRYAPAREMIKQNAIVALGTDFNPGSSMISSQLFIFYLAVFEMGMTIEEAINAVTINAAYAIDRQDRIGSIAVGKQMDVLLLDIPDYSYLAYHPGIHPVHTVIKSGEVVVQERAIVYKE